MHVGECDWLVRTQLRRCVGAVGAVCADDSVVASTGTFCMAPPTAPSGSASCSRGSAPSEPSPWRRPASSSDDTSATDDRRRDENQRPHEDRRENRREGNPS
ncbi:hypothetical protein NQD34_008883 [Periophthalmus magnuspinnatus]|nr:hypothetical protein NQD34_008883 [Periophthalmus magnuspinnatus]